MHPARAASLVCPLSVRPVSAVATAPDFAVMYGDFRE